MSDLRKHEKDERQKLQEISDRMNILHCEMGGRDKRPERVALLKCMAILRKCIDNETQRVLTAGRLVQIGARHKQMHNLG
jgi:hypothetical protein